MTKRFKFKFFKTCTLGANDSVMNRVKSYLTSIIVLLFSAILITGCVNSQEDFGEINNSNTIKMKFLNGTTGEPVFMGEFCTATLSATNFLESESEQIGTFTIDSLGQAQFTTDQLNSCLTCNIIISVKNQNRDYLVQSTTDTNFFFHSDSGTLVLNNWYKGLQQDDTVFCAIQPLKQEHPTFFMFTFPFEKDGDVVIFRKRLRTRQAHRFAFSLNHPLEPHYNPTSGQFELNPSQFEEYTFTVNDDPEITQKRLMP